MSLTRKIQDARIMVEYHAMAVGRARKDYTRKTAVDNLVEAVEEYDRLSRLKSRESKL